MKEDNLKKGLLKYISPTQKTIYERRSGPTHEGSGFQNWLEERSFTPSREVFASYPYYVFDGNSFSEIRISKRNYKTQTLQEDASQAIDTYNEEVTIHFQPNTNKPKSLMGKLEELGFEKI
jgi:ubiquitin